jgi:hypothetical protein
MRARRRDRTRRQLELDEKPDPIVDVLTSGTRDPEPPADEVHKGETAGEAPTGTPVAGRSTIAAVTKGGPFGFLQILGPGLITGASDDDPSGIGTYSQVGSQLGYGFLWTALFTLTPPITRVNARPSARRQIIQVPTFDEEDTP